MCDGNKLYGHSAKGNPCVAVANAKIHFTTSLKVGVSGVKFVKIAEGSSNSIQFLHFLWEVENVATKEGEKVLQRGVNNTCLSYHL